MKLLQKDFLFVDDTILTTLIFDLLTISPVYATINDVIMLNYVHFRFMCL
jgi:hypothetical protein